MVDSKKYLGIILDENLKFKKHMQLLKTKLNRANRLLAKIRHFVSKNLLRTIYTLQFLTHIFDMDVRFGAKRFTRIQKHNNHTKLKILNIKL